MIAHAPKYALFSVFGIEIEYMIVDKQTLEPLPITDEIIKILNNGIITNEVELDDIAVSNELALHVIELKTNGPVNDLNKLDQSFLKVLHLIQNILNKFNAILLPTGMHPWFVPDSSLKLWPHSNNEIYDAYHKIFNCQGHGWGNLQSTHINLPFSTEEEFFKLHEAIRIILPIIPALTASTPFVAGMNTDNVDNRLLYYGKNQAMLPCISGDIIPESIASYNEYREKILLPMYEAIAPYDKEGILQDEWLNSRGAITRFERNAIEIRIVDSQESPIMDIACVMLIVYVLREVLVNNINSCKNIITNKELVSIYKSCIKNGSKTIIDNKNYLKYFSFTDYDNNKITAQDLWHYLYEKIKTFIPQEYHSVVEKCLSSGSLAERLLNSFNNGSDLKDIYNKLNSCLLDNNIY